MITKQYGFRQLDKMTFIITDDKISEYVLQSDYHGGKAIIYGYIDPEAGVSFEIIGELRDDTAHYFDDGQPRKIRYDFVENEEISGFIAPHLPVMDSIQEKYYKDAFIDAMRDLVEIDHLRHPSHPDIVNVVLPVGEDFVLAPCYYVGIEGSDLICYLACEVETYASGERLAVSLTRDSEGTPMLYGNKATDLN